MLTLDPTLPEAPLPGVPERAAAWTGALAFFAILLALALPDMAAQVSSRALGLAWSELCTMLLPALVAAAGSNLRTARYLGLDRPRPLPVLLGALLGVAGFFAANGVMALWVSALPRRFLEWFPDVGRIFEGPALTRTVVGVVAVLLAPFCEEAAFRGYLQRTLLRALRPAAAIALGALLFAARHLDPVRFPALVLLGALFGWMAWRSGSLWPAIAGHAANNALATALAIGTPGDDASPPAPTPWEALVPLLLGLAALAALVLWFRWLTPAPPPPEAAVARRDPDDPSTRFHLRRIPAGLLLAACIGLVALLALAASPALPGAD
jgi:membrane protease YdiL (CAAX protease family)